MAIMDMDIIMVTLTGTMEDIKGATTVVTTAAITEVIMGDTEDMVDTTVDMGDMDIITSNSWKVKTTNHL